MEYEYGEYKNYMTVGHAADVVCIKHIHRQIEIVLVTEGTLEMLYQDKILTVPERSAVLIPSYTMHSFTNRRHHSVCIMEYPQESVGFFHDFLKSTRCSDPVLPLDDALYAYELSRLPAQRDVSHRIPDALAQAILNPLCYAFITHCVFEPTNQPCDDTVIRALNLISNHFDQSITLSGTAEALGIRPETLTRNFREHTGMTFWDFVLTQRVIYAMTLLRRGRSITEAAFEAGFNSLRSFNRTFMQKTGQTPSAFLKTKSDGLYDLYEPEFIGLHRK